MGAAWAGVVRAARRRKEMRRMGGFDFFRAGSAAVFISNLAPYRARKSWISSAWHFIVSLY